METKILFEIFSNALILKYILFDVLELHNS